MNLITRIFKTYMSLDKFDAEIEDIREDLEAAGTLPPMVEPEQVAGNVQPETPEQAEARGAVYDPEAQPVPSVNKTASVYDIYDRHIRDYTLYDHGEQYLELAHKFASAHGHKVKEL